ncbi:unnamed protein product [Rotaria sordida]|uniref:Uncharacterized protein n=1 Tax=Rotaria sordida TaxID=392033 RepID=A0A815QJ85_9BILA|nr:unnamed protein product [Rotaria sordida]
MKRIKRLEAETLNKQNTLDQLKREKIELENTLEKEQESLVNRLWKRMEKLETDKRLLQLKLEQPDQTVNTTNTVCQSSSSSSSKIDEPIVHRNLSVGGSSLIVCEDDISIVQDNNRLNSFLSSNPNSRLSLPNIDYIQQLKREVEKLKRELIHTQESHRQKMEQLVKEEQDIRNENLRLQRKLQLEYMIKFLTVMLLV